MRKFSQNDIGDNHPLEEAGKDLDAPNQNQVIDWARIGDYEAHRFKDPNA